MNASITHHRLFYNIVLTFILITFVNSKVVSQDCNCSIPDVINNTVPSCEMSIGTEVIVSTVAELSSAFNDANSTGGNMTILIEDGEYAIASTASYPYLTASNLVIRSLSGNRDAVILTGQGMMDVAPLTEIVLSLVGDNITVADLTIRDAGNHGISTISDNHLIYNVKFQDTFEQMIKGNSSGDGADNCIVKCCYFEYTAGIGPQWYIGGLDIHTGDDWIVSDNVFFNIASPSITLAEHAIHFWDGSANNLVERNVIVNCDRGVGFGLGSSSNDGGIIRNNMIFNDGSHIYDDVGIGLETSPNTEVYNNSIHIEYQNAIEYRFIASTNIEIANNLTNKNIQSRNGGTATLNSNYTNGQLSWYKDPTFGDLRLNELISDLVDQGTDLTGLVVDDTYKTDRPAGLGYDIGADEYADADVILLENGICLFSNPMEEIFHVTGITSDYLVDILDSNGDIYESISSITDIVIDLSALPNGLFFIRIQHVQHSTTVLEKILKE